MHLCYVDESGTSAIPGNTSHFVLVGISLPIWHWRDADSEITGIKKPYGLEDAELHAAWMLRKYIEQSRISDFDNLPWRRRRSEVERHRKSSLLELQKSGSSAYKQTKKNYEKTNAYIHLTWRERQEFIAKIAECVSRWGFARLFAECIDKIHFDPARAQRSLDEQAFEQIVSRFERYLKNTDAPNGQKNYGLIVHDNNETIAKKHTRLMRIFHQKGTLWTSVERIIETPLFVDSRLTSMVQVADLCSYSLRRYAENRETELFEKIYKRADRAHDRVVGVRHFTDGSCSCKNMQDAPIEPADIRLTIQAGRKSFIRHRVFRRRTDAYRDGSMRQMPKRTPA